MYQFYLDNLLLPVTPEKLTVKTDNQNKTLTLINDGQINILKRAGLSKITFTALLPNVRYPFAQYASGFQPAVYFLSKLEKLKSGLRPFLFRVLRPNAGKTISLEDSDFKVSLEDYTIEEDAEKYGFDIGVTITLLQYQEFATKTLSFKKEEKATATVESVRDTSTKKQETSYTVQKGDSLWSIAKRKLGKGVRFSEIYQLNKDTIEQTAKKYGRTSSSNGWWIYPGTVLKLPI